VATGAAAGDAIAAPLDSSKERGTPEGNVSLPAEKKSRRVFGARWLFWTRWVAEQSSAAAASEEARRGLLARI
jgi:hypothetical protein